MADKVDVGTKRKSINAKSRCMTGTKSQVNAKCRSGTKSQVDQRHASTPKVDRQVK
jgi:hypothetical protein